MVIRVGATIRTRCVTLDGGMRNGWYIKGHRERNRDVRMPMEQGGGGGGSRSREEERGGYGDPHPRRQPQPKGKVLTSKDFARPKRPGLRIPSRMIGKTANFCGRREQPRAKKRRGASERRAKRRRRTPWVPMDRKAVIMSLHQGSLPQPKARAS